MQEDKMAYIDQNLIASACEAIGEGVEARVLTDLVAEVNRLYFKGCDFHALWVDVLESMEVGTDDLFLPSAYRRALSYYYRASRSKKAAKQAAMEVDEVHLDWAKIRVSPTLAIYFHALRRDDCPLKVDDVEMGDKAWKGQRPHLEPGTITAAKKKACAAMNTLRRRPKKRRRK